MGFHQIVVPDETDRATWPVGSKQSWNNSSFYFKIEPHPNVMQEFLNSYLGIAVFLSIGILVLRIYSKSKDDSWVTKANLLIGGLGMIAVSIVALFQKWTA